MRASLGEVGAVFAVVVALVLVGVVSILLNGWALSVLWGWFVAPQFALPPLSVPIAIGLVLTAQLIIRPDYGTTKHKDSDFGDVIGKAVGAAIAPLAVVGVGWLLLHFV